MAKRREKTDKEKFLLSLHDTLGNTRWLNDLSPWEWYVLWNKVVPGIAQEILDEARGRKAESEYW